MDEDIRTLWCGNLSEKVTEEILYELFLQAGPVQRVSIPKDRDGKQRTYGFVTYKHVNSVSYALSLFDGTVLFNRPISMSTRNNVELQQIESSQDHSSSFNHLLQLGQQMFLANDAPHFKIGMFGANMLPNTGSYSKEADDVHSYKDDRRSRRMHPYHREQSKSSNYHKKQRSRNTHNNYRSNDYSKHDYRNNRRNYR